MIQLIPAEEVVSISQWKEIIKAARYEMLPSKKQDVRLNQTLNTLRRLHNDSLEERQNGWKNGGWSVQYDDQQLHLTTLRNKNDEWGKELRNVYTDVEQDAIKRVDKAYERYFDRVKKNKSNPKNYKKPGYPRHKGRNRYKSFTFTRYGYGCHILDRNKNKDINGDIIRLSKIGDIPFIRHKDIGDSGIPFRIKTVTIKKEVDKWMLK
jgi:putative transposase